jgi:hypothetical protein
VSISFKSGFDLAPKALIGSLSAKAAPRYVALALAAVLQDITPA